MFSIQLVFFSPLIHLVHIVFNISYDFVNPLFNSSLGLLSGPGALCDCIYWHAVSTSSNGISQDGLIMANSHCSSISSRSSVRSFSKYCFHVASDMAERENCFFLRFSMPCSFFYSFFLFFCNLFFQFPI